MLRLEFLPGLLPVDGIHLFDDRLSRFDHFSQMHSAVQFPDLTGDFPRTGCDIISLVEKMLSESFQIILRLDAVFFQQTEAGVNLSLISFPVATFCSATLTGIILPDPIDRSDRLQVNSIFEPFWSQE